MKIRRNGPGAWQITTPVVYGPGGIEFWGVHTCGRLLYVLRWHRRIVRQLEQGR